MRTQNLGLRSRHVFAALLAAPLFIGARDCGPGDVPIGRDDAAMGADVQESSDATTTDRCALVHCRPGTHCEVRDVVCITTPCPPQPVCIDDAATSDAGASDAGGTDVPPVRLDRCDTASDCRLFDDYCTGCDCRALARTEPTPVCPGPGVFCFAQPCQMHTVACESNHCVLH
jgi:hypothetical protein